MRHRLVTLGFSLVAAAAPHALAAASAPSAPADSLRWHAGLGYGFESFTRDRGTWHAASAEVGRRFDHGALIGEIVAVRRFGVTDEAAAASVYRTLWRGAYGYLRAQVAPGAGVLPRLDVTAELYHAIRRGPEFVAGYRRMQFEGDHADVFTAGVGAYLPSWYLRARTSLVPRAGRTAVSLALAARRYLRTNDDWLDLSAGIGQELITLGTTATGPLIDVRDNRFAAATYRRFVTPRVGFSVGASYTGTDGLPDRRGLSVSMTTRW